MNKYSRTISGEKPNGEPAYISVDVYDVLEAFDVTCPCLQHMIKKALAAGQRGHKNVIEDYEDIVASAHRGLQLARKRITS